MQGKCSNISQTFLNSVRLSAFLCIYVNEWNGCENKYNSIIKKNCIEFYIFVTKIMVLIFYGSYTTLLHLASTTYFSLMLLTTPILIPEISPPYFSFSFLGSRTCSSQINQHLRDSDIYFEKCRLHSTSLKSCLRDTLGVAGCSLNLNATHVSSQ